MLMNIRTGQTLELIYNDEVIENIIMNLIVSKLSNK